MAMNNPFLSSKVNRSSPAAFSWWSELRRLFGGFRAPLTLFLVLGPLVLSLAGGVDFVQSWFYSFTHKGAADKRQIAFFVDCLTNKAATKNICAGTKASRAKMQFWPFMPVEDDSFFGLARVLSHPAPIWYAGLFLLAFMAFIAIGNPRVLQIGPILLDSFGFKPKTKKGRPGQRQGQPNRAEQKFDGGELLPPAVLSSQADIAHNWILGGTLMRQWAADPGYFYISSEKLSGPKNLLKERPPYFLSSDILRTNLMIVAPQGSGKTTSVFRPAIRFVSRSRGAAIVWDSKGNDFDRADFNYNFDLEDYDNSFRLVVFSGKTPEEAGERLAEALIPELSDDKRYFSDVAKDALAAIVAGHYAAQQCYPELSQMLLYMNKDSESLQELIDLIPARLDDKDEAMRLVANLVGNVKNLTETKSDLLGNLRTALVPLTSPDIKRFLVANPDRDADQQGQARHAFTIEELLRQPGLIRLGLAVADRPRVAPILGRLILAQFVFAVLSPRCNRDILKLAIVDEAHNFVSLPICKGMAQARSNNAGFMLAFQTLSQIANDSMLETIFSLAGTKIVMSGGGNKDSDRFSSTFGKVWLEFVSHSKNSGRSTNKNTGGSRSSGSFMELGTSYEAGSSSKATTNYGQSSTKNQGEGQNTQLQQRELFTSYEIRTLPQHHAIIESANTYGQRWQAQIIDMSQATVNSLEAAFVDETSRLLSGQQSRREPKVIQGEVLAPNPPETALTLPAPQSAQSAAPVGPRQSKPIIKFSVVTGTTQHQEARPAPTTEPKQPGEKGTDLPSIRELTGQKRATKAPATPGGEGRDTHTTTSTPTPHDTTTTAAGGLTPPTTLPPSGPVSPTDELGRQVETKPASQRAEASAATEQPPTGQAQAQRAEELQTLCQALRTYGVDEPSIGWMSQQLLANGRDLAYLHHLAAKPDVENLAGFLNWAISADLDPSWSRRDQRQESDSQAEIERIKEILKEAGVVPRKLNQLSQSVVEKGRNAEYVRALTQVPNRKDLAGWLFYAINEGLEPTDQA